jgi:WD40 repeat protein
MGGGEMGPTPEEFVLLNQDGSGHTLITLYGDDSFLMEGDNSANYMVEIDGDIYVFRPSEAKGLHICRQVWYLGCHTFFSGDEKGGLLASFYQDSDDVSPELILYELPSGKIRERFPLVRCSKDTSLCEEFRSNWPEMMRQQAQWSPNGRYLAFVAILDATSSDLLVYDTQNGNLRRLTNGPDWVGPIEWSPDGTQIIMQEILNDKEFLFDPYSEPPSSVWSVSVSTSEIKLLYSTDDAYTIQNILLWQDDKHFIAYQGFLVNADQARDLRLVDTETGTNQIMFNDVFIAASFDPVHDVVALYAPYTENCVPNAICLVSMKDGTIRALEDPPATLSFPRWDENTGLFVSSSDCESDPQSLQAVNYQGTLRCVPKSTPDLDSLYPAPNEKWSLSIKDGLWLEGSGQPAILVNKEAPSDVMWCPESNCFFFSVLQQHGRWNLYHVSLPDLNVKLLVEGIGSTGTYQWLGVEK